MPCQVKCPSCGQLLTLPDALMGQTVKCGHCQKPFSTQSPAPTAPMPVGKGVVFAGRFKIESELGQGAFGIVYHARDRQLGGRDVAIKMLRSEVVESSEAVDRLKAEAEVMARIVHPNILPVIDHGLSGGRYYIVLPLVRGRTLKDMIPAGGVKDLRQGVAIVVKVARALHHVWSQHRILHRDVKPSNILLLDGDEESLYLMDFGLAACQDTKRVRVTVIGSIMGTPAFMSPEQASGDNARVSHAADLYSAGVVLFQLLTGTVPFPAEYPDVLYDIREKPVPAPSSLRPGLDPALDAIVLKALAKTPERRYATGQAMAKALEDWLALRPASAPRPRAVPAGTASSRTPGAGSSAKAPRASSSRPPMSLPPTPESLRASDSTLPGQRSAQATTGSARLPPPVPAPQEEPIRGNLRRWILIGAGVILILGLLGAGAFALRSSLSGPKGQKQEWWGGK